MAPAWLAFAAMMSIACGPEGPGPDGDVTRDGGASSDSGARDLGRAGDDAGSTTDAGLDGGPQDLGRPDAAWIDAGASDQGGVDGGEDPSLDCLPADYRTYARAHPGVWSASFDTLNDAAKAYACGYLAELEDSQRVQIAEPLASASCEEPQSCTYITPTADERDRILAAKAAHALWVDHHALVPWRLDGFTSDELAGLFDPAKVFRNGTHFMSVVDHSPSEAWAYIIEYDLIGVDPAATIENVLADLRSTDAETDFVHGIGNGTSPDPINTAYTLNEALRTRVERVGGTLVRVSRRGCHTMSRIVIALLRAMNIPGVEHHDGGYFADLHSTPTWPSEGVVVPHADNVYLATSLATPTSELLASEAFYTAAENVAVCGSNRGCLGSRQSSLNAVRYPARYTTRRCCDPATYGYESCAAYLGANYATTLTTEELVAATNAIESNCAP